MATKLSGSDFTLVCNLHAQNSSFANIKAEFLKRTASWKHHLLTEAYVDHIIQYRTQLAFDAQREENQRVEAEQKERKAKASTANSYKPRMNSRPMRKDYWRML